MSLAPGAGEARYDAGYFDSLRSNAHEARELNAREQFRLLARFSNGRTGRLLDVGCGLAEFIERADREGWEVSGCDLPREGGEATPGARVRGRVQYGGPETWRYGESAFDAVTAFGVLEHADEPRELLGRMAGWLRPGGLLLLVTPSLSSWSARLMGRYWPHYHREHRTCFTEPALRTFLESGGFGQVRRFSWRRHVTLDFLAGQAERYFGDVGADGVAAVLRRLPASVRSHSLLLPSGSVGFAAWKRP